MMRYVNIHNFDVNEKNLKSFFLKIEWVLDEY